MTINSFKILMTLVLISRAAAKRSLSILWIITKSFAPFFCDNNSKSKKLDDKDSSLILKLSEHLKHLLDQFNNMLSPPEDINTDDPENTVSSKYCDTGKLQNLKITSKSKSLSFFK